MFLSVHSFNIKYFSFELFVVRKAINKRVETNPKEEMKSIDQKWKLTCFANPLSHKTHCCVSNSNHALIGSKWENDQAASLYIWLM